MSRRDSRAHLAVRQNDALLEFENFKRKYLLVNKHITKLNSTLSIRIEELNAQISELYVENLRLRSSEISLAAQLYREREKSRRLMHEVENTVAGLSTRFSSLREAYGIPSGVDPAPPTLPPLRARKPLRTSSGTTPQRVRVSRAPDVPHINEVPSEDEVSNALNTPERPQSRLDHNDIFREDDIAMPRPKKPSRRQSGLMTTMFEPTTMSPPPDDDEHEEMDIVDASAAPCPPLLPQPTPVLRKVRRLSGPTPSPSRQIVEPDEDAHSEQERKEKERDERARVKVREAKERARVDKEHRELRERERSETEHRRQPLVQLDPGQLTGLRDVTNASPPPQFKPLKTTKISIPIAPVERVPTPVTTECTTDSATEEALGRERRARKSVNYAEPKLNTKMRKPDPPEGAPAAPTRRKKSSTSSRAKAAIGETAGDEADGEGRPPGATFVRRHTIAA